MRMVGPNCMGMLNTDGMVNLNGTFAPVYPPPGNVAMLSQSGALGIAILDYAQRNAIGISSFVSVGNKADVSGNDLILYWEDDPATDVIVLYLESFGNPRRFARIARRVAASKPIVAVKSGRTAAGSRAASSHTGALASTDRAVEALFREAGVIRTDTLEELFGVTQILANQPIPCRSARRDHHQRRRSRILAADALAARGMELPEFSPALQAALDGELPAEASAANPVDMIAGAGPDEYEHSVGALLRSDEVDAVIAIYVPTSLDGAAEVAAKMRDVVAAADRSKTVLTVFMSDDVSAHLLRDDRVAIPSFAFPEAAALALARAAEYGLWLERPAGSARVFDDIDIAAARRVVERALETSHADGVWLESHEVEAVLEAFGISLPAAATAQSPEDAVDAARTIGGAVAMKVIAESAVHKSDVGGVKLDVEGDEEVRRHSRRSWVSSPMPKACSSEEMVFGGEEVLIGMTEDVSFGPLIVFGLGGVFVELVGDVAFRLHPVSDVDARSMVDEIRTAPLLHGYRGSAPGDIDALVETIQRVSAMVTALPEMVELDLNPIKVFPVGHGVRAVDARIRVRALPERWVPELADIPSVMDDR